MDDGLEWDQHIDYLSKTTASVNYAIKIKVYYILRNGACFTGGCLKEFYAHDTHKTWIYDEIIFLSCTLTISSQCLHHLHWINTMRVVSYSQYKGKILTITVSTHIKHRWQRLSLLQIGCNTHSHENKYFPCWLCCLHKNNIRNQ